MGVVHHQPDGGDLAKLMTVESITARRVLVSL